MSTIIQATSAMPCSETDLSKLRVLCQRIMMREDFQRLAKIKLYPDDDFKAFAQIILSNCIEDKSHAKIRKRAAVAVCYFLNIHDAIAEESKQELLNAFIKELCKYDVPWVLKSTKPCKYHSLFPTVVYICILIGFLKSQRVI